MCVIERGAMRKVQHHGEEGRYMMLNIHDEQNTETSVSALQNEERRDISTGKLPVAPRSSSNLENSSRSMAS